MALLLFIANSKFSQIRKNITSLRNPNNYKMKKISKNPLKFFDSEVISSNVETKQKFKEYLKLVFKDLRAKDSSNKRKDISLSSFL